ncbi:MAG: threonine synthase [Candidatus Izemoplasmatales bacterium]|nr:threonine synthase [Candidatus Izemoplasmatales bacterium]
MNVSGFVCTLCGKHYPKQYESFTCEDCQDIGILEVLYDYETIKNTWSKTDLLTSSVDSMWRYLPLLPVKNAPINALRVGNTPLYLATNLAKKLGCGTLYVKDEGLNPTGSLKDRASLMACQKAIEAGFDTICASSTGNAASSLAGNAAKLGLKTVIFVPKRAPIAKITQLQIFGSTLIVVDGDYKQAFELSTKAIKKYGFYNRNAAINPFLVEGKKTVAIEICEQLKFQVPDWVVVSVGDGCTIAGVYQGFYDFYQLGFMDSMPKLLGVQATLCQPLVLHDPLTEEIKESSEDTIADSIAVGIPRNPKKAIRAVANSNGAWIGVTDQQILEAMTLLGSTEGVFSEPAASASLAGLQAALTQGIIQKEETVVIISTGNGLKDIINASKATTPIELTPPTLEALQEFLAKKGSYE